MGQCSPYAKRFGDGSESAAVENDAPLTHTATPSLKILYQDEHLVAIHKPSGLLVHPSSQAPDKTTCMNLLRDQLQRWVYPIHRLDRGTSGVLLFCLDQVSARLVSREFQERRVEKEYLALTRGWVEEAGEIDSDIDGKQANTRYRPLARVELDIPVKPFPRSRYSLLAVYPKSGVTHQIRRHLRRLARPVVGDTKHGCADHNRMFRERFNFHRLALVARRLRLRHPQTEEELSIETEVDPELEHLFSSIGVVLS